MPSVKSAETIRRELTDVRFPHDQSSCRRSEHVLRQPHDAYPIRHSFSSFRPFSFCRVIGRRGRGAKGSTEGIFVGIERDSQAHFLIKEKDGHEHSFVILSPDDSVKPYLDNPAKFKGRPVKVYWHKKVVADGLMTIVVKVE